MVTECETENELFEQHLPAISKNVIDAATHRPEVQPSVWSTTNDSLKVFSWIISGACKGIESEYAHGVFENLCKNENVKATISAVTVLLDRPDCNQDTIDLCLFVLLKSSLPALVLPHMDSIIKLLVRFMKPIVIDCGSSAVTGKEWKQLSLACSVLFTLYSCSPENVLSRYQEWILAVYDLFHSSCTNEGSFNGCSISNEDSNFYTTGVSSPVPTASSPSNVLLPLRVSTFNLLEALPLELRVVIAPQVISNLKNVMSFLW
jgi:hypothetical protein